ncbi:uncharacterized protein G2W53_025578 [Senna tora]|uniref:Uncharacterized protein n=1 Tax=Senna tora TaxID=362788 RepID=A0A834TDC9_9FABA|nr:uncharacterized protein G2W53_025578 [Senna tora]
MDVSEMMKMCLAPCMPFAELTGESMASVDGV